METLDHAQERSASGKLIYLIAFLLGSAIATSCVEKRPENEYDPASKVVADSIYMQAGKSIVAHTFDTLRSSLLKAIGSQGLDGAVAFCNENAYPITSTYGDSVTVRRSALRYRNPVNKPDSLELLVLDEIEGRMRSAKSLTPKLVRNQLTGEVHFFQPILLQAMCVNCHGTPGKQIQNSTLSRIQQAYPDDHAVNYKEGDLRGVWHVIFNAKKSRGVH
jgi:hypothetical protein